MINDLISRTFSSRLRSRHFTWRLPGSRSMFILLPLLMPRSPRFCNTLPSIRRLSGSLCEVALRSIRVRFRLADRQTRCSRRRSDSLFSLYFCTSFQCSFRLFPCWVWFLKSRQSSLANWKPSLRNRYDLLMKDATQIFRMQSAQWLYLRQGLPKKGFMRLRLQCFQLRIWKFAGYLWIYCGLVCHSAKTL